MTLEQLKLIDNTYPDESLITIDHLNDKSDRTLLYGYTCERDTWHVYIKDEKIYVVIYPYKQPLISIQPVQNSCYIPNKRLYPAACDFEFCMLLKQKGVNLHFTTWSDRIREQYYGEVLP